MKKVLFSLILNFLFNTFSSAQSKYEEGYKIGFKEGYCYNKSTYDCFTPMTPLAPLPRLNENKENYTDGYNRGFQLGLDLKRVNDNKYETTNQINIQMKEFNAYIEATPVDAMVAVGMYKQKIYDLRIAWIKKRIEGLVSVIYTLFSEENLACKSCNFQIIANEEIKKLTANFGGKDYSDYSINTVFQNVQKKFDEFEIMLYSDYQKLVRYYNEK